MAKFIYCDWGRTGIVGYPGIHCYRKAAAKIIIKDLGPIPVCAGHRKQFINAPVYKDLAAVATIERILQ